MCKCCGNYGKRENSTKQTRNLPLLFIVSVVTTFLALGGFWNCFKMTDYSMVYEFSLVEVCILLGIDSFVAVIFSGGIINMLLWIFTSLEGLLTLLFLSACIFSIVSLIKGVVFVVKLIGGNDGIYLTRISRSVARCQWSSIILLSIFILIVQNGATSPLNISFWGWVVLILALVNNFGICTAYERYWYATSPDACKMKERVCARCSTHYSVGNRCPECGSRDIR